MSKDAILRPAVWLNASPVGHRVRPLWVVKRFSSFTTQFPTRTLEHHCAAPLCSLLPPAVTQASVRVTLRGSSRSTRLWMKLAWRTAELHRASVGRKACAAPTPLLFFVVFPSIDSACAAHPSQAEPGHSELFNSDARLKVGVVMNSCCALISMSKVSPSAATKNQ